MLSFLYKKKLVFLFFLFWAILLGIKPNLGYAGFIDSKKGFIEEREKYLEKIERFFQDKKVVAYLNKMGMDKEIIWERIKNLDNEKLREIAWRCDMLKVGGNSGVIIVILVLLLLIFVVLYFTNYTIKIEPRNAVPRRY